MRGQTFLFPALFKTVALPPVLTFLLLKFLPTLPSYVRLLLYIISFPVLFTLRGHWSVLQQKRKARASGATSIPRVVGRWPLNLDILMDWSKSGAEEEVGRMIELLSRRYGKTFNTRVLGEDQIISLDPAVTQHVLVTDFDNFGKGPKFKDRAEDFFGDGIFNTDGERWRFHRQLTRPFFHHSHVSPATFTPHIERFLTLLPRPESGHAVDIQSLCGKLALNVAIVWMCGEDVRAMDPLPETPPNGWRKACLDLPAALAQAQRVVGRRVKIGTLWPLFELTGDPLMLPMASIRSFFRPVIDRGVERKNARLAMTGEAADLAARATLLDRLIDATDDLKLVEDQLINILVASRDTTTALLAFLAYSMALHPEITRRIQDEILLKCPAGVEVDRNHLKHMPATRAFVNETLRLFPPVPLNIRRSVRDTLLPGSPPLFMPANTSIIITTSLLQRSKEVWGENAEEFDIDRWLDGTVSERDELKFQAWNIGPRMCLGQPFAMTAAMTFLVHLAHMLRAPGQTPLKFVLAPDAQPLGTRMPDAWKSSADGDGRARHGRDRLWIIAEVVLAIKGGLWVRLEEDGDHE